MLEKIVDVHASLGADSLMDRSADTSRMHLKLQSLDKLMKSSCTSGARD